MNVNLSERFNRNFNYNNLNIYLSCFHEVSNKILYQPLICIKVSKRSPKTLKQKYDRKN